MIKSIYIALVISAIALTTAFVLTHCAQPIQHGTRPMYKVEKYD